MPQIYKLYLLLNKFYKIIYELVMNNLYLLLIKEIPKVFLDLSQFLKLTSVIQ